MSNHSFALLSAWACTRAYAPFGSVASNPQPINCGRSVVQCFFLAYLDHGVPWLGSLTGGWKTEFVVGVALQTLSSTLRALICDSFLALSYPINCDGPHTRGHFEFLFEV